MGIGENKVETKTKTIGLETGHEFYYSQHSFAIVLGHSLNTE